CIEAFFSGDQKDITRSVSVGLASVLVFGGYQFAPVEDYPVLKKRIAKLYGLRSKAVHRASRTHITENDVAELSHRVAQLLANAISFSERGYKTTEE
ncbi:hypothetical protein NL349_26725, partial [Klebsiella pneumoniae]|nr:hypothetical protein [Klebsiella pneumoniae]